MSGVSLQNSAALAWGGGSLAAGASAVTIVEPTLTLATSADPGTALPGTEITFTLTLGHAAASDSTAFDLLLTDVVPAGLTYVPGSLAVVSGQAATLVDESSAPTLSVGWDTFLDNGTGAIVEFRATLGNPSAGESVSNSALLRWSSLPGDVSSPQPIYNALSTERFNDPASGVNSYGVTAQAMVMVPALRCCRATPPSLHTST